VEQIQKTEESKKVSVFEVWLDRIVSRRQFFKRLGWGGVIAFLLGTLIASVRFFYPRILFEPPTRFTVGKPSEYPLNMVNTEYKDKHGIWIVRNVSGQFFCLSTKCPHLGCTPNWLETQKKFKCPCHGSGFYLNGENFEGPSPRPLDRFHISLSADGQMVVDKSIIYKGKSGMDSNELYPQSLLNV
jgi:cytochrome b6-f complex iron-sulfur subunit